VPKALVLAVSHYAAAMDTISGTLTRNPDDSWTVVLPEIGQVTIDDPRLADFECRQMLQRHLGIAWSTAAEIDVRLVDGAGAPLYVFELLCTGPVESGRVAALAAAPPDGCHFADVDGMPMLRCVRSGSSRLSAVATLVEQLRVEYGLDADDLGFERLWEWAGSREERERMVAQLLLMATQRARQVGLPADDLVEFVRTTMA
jgi:hypothetical protein